MQLLNNSGYSQKFRTEILKSGLEGYNKIVKAEKEGVRPVYRPKGWKESARWLEKNEERRTIGSEVFGNHASSFLQLQDLN